MKSLLLPLVATLVFTACKKSEPQSQPARLATITTTPVTTITSETATSGGDITNDGEAPITERGICFNTSGSPTMSADSKVVSGTGPGSFMANMSGLTEGTTYYVRAYAINNAGTAYGNEEKFATFYHEVNIGTQVWMKKNLSVSHYRNGDTIPEITDSAAWDAARTGAWCWYNNDPSNDAAYGKLYNWYAVNDPRGLAPEGWHVPGDAEWDTLVIFLGGQAIAGGAMKETGTNNWFPPNTDATNSSGFTALPGGSRFGNGTFGLIGPYGVWWSSTPYQEFQAWYRTLQYNSASMYGSHHDVTTRYGFSVRCVND